MARKRKISEATEAQRVFRILQARDKWAGDELEVDDDAKTSEAPDDNGCWVQAWVWVEDQV